jgi:hypothetical protein
MLSKRDLDEPVKLSALKSDSAGVYSRTGGAGYPGNTPERTERKLSIDERGRAELTDSATRQISSAAFSKPADTSDGPRFQSRIGFPEKESAPVMFMPPEPERETVKPVTRIDDLLRDKSSLPADDAVRDVLRPKPASVIPEEITRLQQGTAKPSSFDESVREYYKTPSVPSEQYSAAPESFLEPTIPEGATAPKEKIAPVRRKKPGSTVDELMKMIDDQTSKRR